MEKTSFSNKILPYLFLAPAIIGLGIFSYIAMGKAIFNAFTDKQWGMATHFVGLENFIKAFQDKMFLESFKNQVIISVSKVFSSVFFPLLAAELVFFIKNKRIGGLVRIAFVVPMLVPRIVITLVWKYLYNPNYGFNNILDAIGLNALTRNWLNDGETALFAIIFTGFPFIAGLYFLMMHTGLNMLGRELYEAAIIDGATSSQVVWNIHIPNMMPYVKTIVTLSLIGSLASFGDIAAMTGGGPGYATMIPALQMYNVAFGDLKFGYASALGVITMIVIVILTVVMRKMLSNKEDKNA
ncbi:MAG: sugar ABC transporter permease [Clostridiaceae bacterium]|nr:sugar ABC transporter permease [Clostridiaceae bacterium]